MNEYIMESLFPGTRAALASGTCPTCSKPIGPFKDELSRREYRISGMCQECQDSVFDAPEDDDEEGDCA